MASSRFVWKLTYSTAYIVIRSIILLKAWVGHPYYDVIDNTTDFERKVVRMIAVSTSFSCILLLTSVAFENLEVWHDL